MLWLAVDGEYGGAALYIAEHAPNGQRGRITGYLQSTVTAGMSFSLLVTITCRLAIGVEKFAQWGWRIPFWISILLIGASLYIRMKLSESPMFAAIKENGHHSKNPIYESFTNLENMKYIAIAFFGCTMGIGIMFYTLHSTLYTFYKPL